MFHNLFNALILAIAASCISLSVYAQAEPKPDTISKYLEALEKNPDDKASLKAVGYHFMTLGNDKETKKYADKLLKIAKKEKDRDYAELHGLILLASVFLSTNHLEALKIYNEALSIAQRTDNHEALLSIYNGLGIYNLFRVQDTTQAVEYFQKALEEAKITNDKRRYAIITANLAGVYITRNDPNGLALAKEANDYASKNNDAIPSFYAKFNLALLYSLNDSINQAEKILLELDTLNVKEGFNVDFDLLVTRAEIQTKKGEYALAEKTYNNAEEIISGQEPSSVVVMYISMAELQERKNNFAAALNLYDKAIEIAEKYQLTLYTPNIFDALAKLYAKQGDYTKAYDFIKKEKNITDSIFQKDRERYVQESRVRNDVYQKELRISEQEEEIRYSRKRAFWFSAIITLLITIVFVILLAQRRKNKLYRAIVDQNKAFRERELVYKRREAQLEEKLNLTGKTGPGHVASSPSAAPNQKLQQLTDAFIDLLDNKQIYRNPNLTINQVADMLESNRTYISKAINEILGKSFSQVVNEYRIQEAIALLSDHANDIPIKQIPEQVGFSALSTFYTTFQTITGLSPASYRKHALK